MVVSVRAPPCQLQGVAFDFPAGSRRAAEYVGVGEMSAWFGGAPTVVVVFPDTQSGTLVEVDRVIPRREPPP